MISYKLFATYENCIQEAVLYDLTEDPSKTSRNVKQQHPELFKYMTIEMEELRQSVIWSANDEVKCVGYSISPDSQCYEDESPQCKSGWESTSTSNCNSHGHNIILGYYSYLFCTVK